MRLKSFATIMSDCVLNLKMFRLRSRLERRKRLKGMRRRKLVINWSD
jgi:hypothetical protein